MSKIKENNCICLSCGKSFYKAKERIEHGGGKYCSKKCRDIGFTKKQLCICLWCKKEFFEKVARIKVGRGKYCSKKCYNEFLADGNMRGENSPSWKGGEQLVSCFMCKKEFYIKQYLISKKIHFCSHKCHGKYMSQYIIKENHPRWNPILSKYFRDRGSDKSINWRKSVFKRDNYTCQKCGDSKGGNLNAHHIIPFSVDESLRFDVSNGITLCTKCHKKEHLRLSKKKNKQMDIFQIRKENKCQ